MKRFIKNNLVFLIVMLLALALVLMLLVLVIFENGRMNRADGEVAQLKSQIEELIKQDPAPVQGNIEPITRETELYQKKVDELKVMFGGVRRPAMEAFFKTLGVDETEFMELLNNEWSEDEDRNNPGGYIRFYQLFSRGGKSEGKWNLAKWNRARDAFAEEYRKITIEDLKGNNVDEVLMQSLGIPRNFDKNGETCLRNFMWPMRARMADLFAGKIPNLDGSRPERVELMPEAAAFGFDFNRTPKADERLDNITRNFEVIGDLGRRIVNSKVQSLNSFYIRNNEFLFAGEQQGPFTVYHYNFSVTGKIEAIRDLVKGLNEAAKERRVYLIRSIYLYAVTDGAMEVFIANELAEEARRMELIQDQEAGAEGAGMGMGMGMGMGRSTVRRSAAARNQANMMGMGMGMMGMGMMDEQAQREREARLAAEDAQKPYNERRNYGRVLFGGDDVCEAILDVEYVFMAEPKLTE
ncbi:MAG: hypothetical protein IJC73_04085 [Lentisphaeria bacterium]|nr:hypothetical protein [Lentisphaeria bacterium]